MKGTTTECHMPFAQIIRSYRQTMGVWKGCDWPTHFGPLGLNLNGLNVVQATLMSGATTGREGTEWRRAAKWLARVELDAQKAEQNAKAAVDLVSRHHFQQALARIQNACDLEAHYHHEPVWQPLRNAIAALKNQVNPVAREAAEGSCG